MISVYLQCTKAREENIYLGVLWSCLYSWSETNSPIFSILSTLVFLGCISHGQAGFGNMNGWQEIKMPRQWNAVLFWKQVQSCPCEIFSSETLTLQYVSQDKHILEKPLPAKTDEFSEILQFLLFHNCLYLVRYEMDVIPLQQEISRL